MHRVFHCAALILTLLTIGPLRPGPAWAANLLVEQLRWGSYGTGDGQFQSPHGIATDADGDVYVVDIVQHRIQKFTANGVFITKWGGYGQGPGQFYYPHGVAIGSDGTVYVSDTYRVQAFTPTGSYLTQWGDCYPYEIPGCFANATDVIRDGAGNVYAIDATAKRVHRHDLSGWTNWHVTLPNDVEFVITRFDVDANGRFAIGNATDKRIEFYSSAGTWLSSLGSSGSGPGQFNGPTAMSFDVDGNLWVADFGNFRLQKFSAAGAYLGEYTEPLSNFQDAFAAPGGVVYAARNNDTIVKLVPATISVPASGTEVGLALAVSPNPSPGDSRLDLVVPVAGRARLEILDVRGRRVAVVLDRDLAAGRHHAMWNGRGSDGRSVEAGVYFARFQMAGEVEQRSIVRVR